MILRSSAGLEIDYCVADGPPGKAMRVGLGLVTAWFPRLVTISLAMPLSLYLLPSYRGNAFHYPMPRWSLHCPRSFAQWLHWKRILWSVAV